MRNATDTVGSGLKVAGVRYHLLGQAAERSLIPRPALVTPIAHSSHDFRVVDEPGPTVLRITGHIVGLVITTPPEKDQLVDETVFTSSAGAMTLLLDASDSLTGEPLVRVGDRQDISQGSGIGQFYWSNPVSNAGAARP